MRGLYYLGWLLFGFLIGSTPGIKTWKVIALPAVVMFIAFVYKYGM